MTFLIEGFKALPDVFWSAVVASLLTLFSVLLTNKGYEKRQVALLKHEEKKYQSEQQLALKKEVFLNLAASFSDVLLVFPKLMNLDFSQQDIELQTVDHSGIVSKSYLVAKEESVEAILLFSTDVAETLILMHKERANLLALKNDMVIYQSQINAANDEKDRLISLMKEFNLQGSNNQQTFDYLKKSYKFQDEIAQESNVSFSTKQKELEPLHLAFSKKCLIEHGRLVSLSTSMIVALRKELETDQNPQIFIDALNHSVNKMNRVFKNMFDDT